MTSLPPVSRRSVVGTAAVGAAAATSPMLWVPPAAAAFRPSGAHLTFGSDPRREMTVSWLTPEGVKRPRLEIGRDFDFGTVITPENTGTKQVGTVYHHAQLDGLRPGTRYTYRISHSGGPSIRGTFTTAPRRQRRFRFAAFGDMGVNDAARAHVRLIRKVDPKFAFVVGDLCYADSSGGLSDPSPLPQDTALWDGWLRQIQPSSRRIPWMTTVGNHEMERGMGELGYDGYLDRFRLPDSGPRNAPVTYSYTYGNVGFIALDGNDVSTEISRNNDYLGNRQDRWLVQTLTRMRRDKDLDFIVVGFHNCMYCSNLVHGSDGGNRSRWEPIFDRFTVDLVVNGHNHCYERTHLVRGGEPVKEARRGSTVNSRVGTTYLTAGGAGQAPYPAEVDSLSYVTVEGGVRAPETTPWKAFSSAVHSLAFIDVKPPDNNRYASMTIRGVNTQGRLIDKVTLRRRRPR